MATYHTVQQGEHVSGIAKRYGFTSYHTIWDHPQNAELKRERVNPNVLFPSDRIFIPDKEERQELRPTDQRHRFRVQRPELRLRLILEDLYEKPIASAKCDLRIEGEIIRLTTEPNGRIDRPIAPEVQNAMLVVNDLQTPVNEIAIPVLIGHLNPVDKVSGQTARLNNLGYFAGPVEGKAAEANKALFLSAVEEFQCDHGLTVDGKCGPATQAKLKQVHGC